MEVVQDGGQQPPEVTLLIAAVDRNRDRRTAWFNATVADLMHQDITLARLEVLLLSLVPLAEEPDFVQHAVSSVPGTFKHIFFRTDPGVYKMWNRGWSMALGEFVATLNLDDRLAHTALREKAAFLRQHEACDVVSCIVVASPEVVSFEQSKGRYLDNSTGTPNWKRRGQFFTWKWMQVVTPSIFLRAKGAQGGIESAAQLAVLAQVSGEQGRAGWHVSARVRSRFGHGAVDAVRRARCGRLPHANATADLLLRSEGYEPQSARSRETAPDNVRV